MCSSTAARSRPIQPATIVDGRDDSFLSAEAQREPGHSRSSIHAAMLSRSSSSSATAATIRPVGGSPSSCIGIETAQPSSRFVHGRVAQHQEVRPRVLVIVFELVEQRGDRGHRRADEAVDGLEPAADTLDQRPPPLVKNEQVAGALLLAAADPHEHARVVILGT